MTDSLEHFVRGHFTRGSGQIAWNTLPGGISLGGRKIGAPYQGAESLKHLARGQIDGALHQRADSLKHLAWGKGEHPGWSTIIIK